MNNDTVRKIFCSQCGTPNDADANFCTSCGSKLAKPKFAAPVAEEPKAEEPAAVETPEIEEPVVVPVVEEPAVETPVVEEPVEEAPAVEPVVVPIVEEPAVEAPVVEEPVAEAPAVEPVVVPVVEEPVVEAPVVEEPVEEVPAVEPVVVPVAEETVVEAPVVVEPVEEAPVVEPVVVPVEEPVVETPVVEEPIEEAPAVEPVVVPVVEEPAVEAPVVEESVAEAPAVEPVVPVVTPVVEEPAADPVPETPKAQKPVKEKAVKEKPVKEKKVKEKPVKEKPVKEKKVKEKPVKEKKVKEKPVKEKPVKEKKVKEKPVEINNVAHEDAPAPVPAEHKKRRRQNIFLRILSALIALVLTAALAAAIPITLLNLFLTEQNIGIIVDRAVSSIDIDQLEIPTSGGTNTLSGALLDVTSGFEGWNHITEEQIDDALLEDFVTEFVTDTLTQYGMSLKDGEQMLGWTPEQIYDFVEANRETIEQLARDAGYEGTLQLEEKKDDMIINIENVIGKDGISVASVLGASDEADKISDYLSSASILFSDYTLYLAWGIVAFIAILLIFVNIGYFGSFLRSCGFPAFILGCLYFLAALAVNPILSLINLPSTALTSVADFTFGFLAAYLMDISVIVAAVGLGMIIVSLIADAIKRKINKE